MTQPVNNNYDTTSIPLIHALRKRRSNGQVFVPPFAVQSAVEEIIENVGQNPEIALTRVKRYIGGGASAVIVFETEDGDVLKLTDSNHFPLRRPHESFDVPIYKKGRAGKFYYYLEEKLYQHSLSDGFVKIVKDMIREKGYKPYDIEDGATHQIGISKDGKLYLLDPECARYKSIFHAIKDKLSILLRIKLR